jgi:hypothetical protein
VLTESEKQAEEAAELAEIRAKHAPLIDDAEQALGTAKTQERAARASLVDLAERGDVECIAAASAKVCSTASARQAAEAALENACRERSNALDDARRRHRARPRIVTVPTPEQIERDRLLKAVSEAASRLLSERWERTQELSAFADLNKLPAVAQAHCSWMALWHYADARDPNPALPLEFRQLPNEPRCPKREELAARFYAEEASAVADLHRRVRAAEAAYLSEVTKANAARIAMQNEAQRAVAVLQREYRAAVEAAKTGGCAIEIDDNLMLPLWRD